MKESPLDEPCVACGWTDSQQKQCSYASTVKLFYGASDRGVWSIGSNIILKEKPGTDPDIEASVLRFLDTKTDILAPKLLKVWLDDGGRHFTLLGRIEGETLDIAWPNLSTASKERIADQAAKQLAQLRAFRSPKMQNIEGGPIYSDWLFLQGINKPHGPFESDTAFATSMGHSLSQVPKNIRSILQSRMTEAAPYTLTHGDLTICNIIVKDGELAGILDWESAGYYPVWWEYVSLQNHFTPEDKEWKSLLSDRIDAYPEARTFWLDFYSLHRWPDLDERGETILRSLQNEELTSVHQS